MALPVAIGLWVFGLGLLGLLTAILWVIALVDLLGKRSDLDRGRRAGWVLLIVLLPMIGSIWYFAQRPVLDDERDEALRNRSGKYDRLSR